MTLLGGAHAQSATTGTTDSAAAGGPIRLRQPAVPNNEPPTPVKQAMPPQAASARKPQPPKYRPGEFELFVQRRAGQDETTEPEQQIRRFGAELMTEPAEAAEAAPLVPPDYLVKPGDEVVLTLWGSVDADLRLLVDRSGRVSVPRVGPVLVAGVRYADLQGVISQRVAQVFRNFQLSVSLGQLRAQRVYITGFVSRPGSYNVSSLATVAQALMQAGGPAAAGSFRQIELRRGKEQVASLDLYDLLVRGDRGGDRVLHAEDVIHVGAVGTQVGFIGSINRPAVFELKAGETVADLLAMAGGFNAVADTTRLAVERLDDRPSVRIVQLPLPQSISATLTQGDVVRAFSAVDVALPVQRQNKRVRVEGEVVRPGEYVLPPASTVADALAAAGGLTPAAFVFGAEFSRESVRLTQQQNYDRALRDLETDLARAGTSQRTATAPDEVAAQAARENANTRLLTTLRALRPNGRIVLQLHPESRDLPPLALEDGDRLYVPARPTTVGVFGSVFNGGSYLHGDGRTLGEYLSLAGGPTRGADQSSTFVIRANGSVVSTQQRGSWLARDNALASARAEPGDTVFVPEEMNKTTFIQNAKDWTQILYQFGLGIAGIVAVSR